MRDVAAIILAGGMSRRMGAQNKLLLPIAGCPMIRHVVRQYKAAFDGPIVVVAGHDAPDVERALADCDVQCVFNPDYETGQQTSVAVGLRHAPDASSLLIGLGDQPVLQAADIRALLDAHAAAGRGKISIPVSDETRGNPIVVPHGLRAGLTADPARAGCMRFTRENPALVQRHTLRAEGFYKDIDTPDDYIDLTHEEGLTL